MANPISLPDQVIGGSGNYEAGNGISISNDTISVKVDGDTVTFNESGELQASGGGGASYSAGDGISISEEDEISVKVDGTSVTVNASGELQAAGASYTAGDGIIIDGNDAISAAVDGSSIKVQAPSSVVTNRNSFYGYLSIPVEKFVDGLTGSTKNIYNIQYGVDTVPFKLAANSTDAYGCEVRLVIGCDSSFTKYAVGTVSLTYNGSPVTLANDSLETVFNNPIEIGNSMSQRGFSDLFDFSECTFDEVFSGTDLYFKLVAWDSNLGVADNLSNPYQQSGTTYTYWPATVTMSGSVFRKQLQASNPGLLNNTAGITNIVSVSALPGSPDAHTLYLVTGV